MLPPETRIAGCETVENWLQAREQLQADLDRNELANLFDRFFIGRLQSRYFDPIEQIAHYGAKDGEGFAIVTLYCSIIEFLASIRTGKSYRHVFRNQEHTLGEFEYSNSKEIFVDFLCAQDPFRGVFDSREKAEDFYKNVRCALVHEARTNGGWIIRSDSALDFALNCDTKTINRAHFPKLFSRYIETYREQFRADKILRDSFIRKFDRLCE